jgi:glycosyltransferase involved in cell wall biosynthesis
VSIHVLHVGKYYEPYRGGIEALLKSICGHPGAGVTTEALVANHSPGTMVETIDGVRVTRVHTTALISSIPFCPTFPYWMRKRRADIVCLHEPNPMALLSYMLVRPRGRLLIWFHSEIVGRPAFSAFYRPWLTAVLARATGVIVTSPRQLDHIDVLRAVRHKSHVIPLGVPLQKFALTAALSAKADALRRRADRPILLFVGRLTYYKGVEYLVQAMEQIDAKLLIVGSGPRRNTLEEEVARRQLGGRIEFAGEIDDADLVAYYHACDLFVLPSVERSEAFGLVQIEAMACARPVISTDLPTGVPWVNQHEVTGLVVPPRDAAALARAINTLLANSTQRALYGQQARLRAQSEFSEEMTRARTTAVYRALLNEDASPEGSVLETVTSDSSPR